MDKDKIEILKSIGLFYLDKNEGHWENARKEIEEIWITAIDVTSDHVSIKAVHVGLLIGRRGTNIDDLSNYLGRKIHIIEEVDLGWLIPENPDEPQEFPFDESFPLEEHF